MIEKVRWSGQTSQKYTPPPSTKWYFPPYEHALYKDEREWRAMKSLLTSPTAQNHCPIVIRYQNLGQACRFRL